MPAIRFVFMATLTMLAGCTSWVRTYDNGKAASDLYAIEFEKSHAQLTDVSKGERWTLPLRVDKLTYPRWHYSRFSQNDRFLLVPVELIVGCVGDIWSSNAIDARGRSRCYRLFVFDLNAKHRVTSVRIDEPVLQRHNFFDGNEGTK